MAVVVYVGMIGLPELCGGKPCRIPFEFPVLILLNKEAPVS